MDLDPVEQRVLGCLIEKRRTTPDGYPLSLNALRSACNQSTNRDPVTAYTDEEVREAATGLHRHGLVRIAAAGQGSRTTKYRHTAEEGLPATDDELAVISVLLVRGPQTRGELRTRTERIHAFGSLDEISATLDGLGRRGLIELLDREPGAREARYIHRLGHRDDPEVAAAVEQAAAEHRARLIAEGRLPAPGDEGEWEAHVDIEVGGGDADPAPAVQPGPPATPTTTSVTPPSASRFVDAGDGYEYAIGDDQPSATPVTSPPSGGPTTAELLARIEALEKRIDDLEELVVD